MSAGKRIPPPDPLENYCLDSSALLTLWNDEPGAETVEEILRTAGNIVISFMTIMECRYRLWRQVGKEKSEEFRDYLELLPVKVLENSETLMNLAVEIKAGYPLSVVDSWIIATAVHTHSILVHKDPEFEPLKERVRLLNLPYKIKTIKTGD